MRTGGAGAADAVCVDHRLHHARPVGHLTHLAADGRGRVAGGGHRKIRQEHRHTRRRDRARAHQVFLEALPGGHDHFVAGDQHHVHRVAPFEHTAHVQNVALSTTIKLDGRDIRIRTDAARGADRGREVASFGRGAQRGLSRDVEIVARDPADLGRVGLEHRPRDRHRHTGEIRHTDRDARRLVIELVIEQRVDQVGLDLGGGAPLGADRRQEGQLQRAIARHHVIADERLVIGDPDVDQIVARQPLAAQRVMRQPAGLAIAARDTTRQRLAARGVQPLGLQHRGLGETQRRVAILRLVAAAIVDWPEVLRRRRRAAAGDEADAQKKA